MELSMADKSSQQINVKDHNNSFFMGEEIMPIRPSRRNNAE
jgi:hypothetical protein